MSHPLDGARAKVKRAKEQVQELNTRINADARSGIIFRDDGDETIVLANIPATTAMAWSVLIGELAHNCRSALDYVVWQLSGSPESNATEFPIFWSAEKYKSDGVRKIKLIPEAAATIIEELQPYHRGDKYAESPLYQLHDLNRFDKHRKLQFVGIKLAAMEVRIDPIASRGRGYVNELSFSPPSTKIVFDLENGSEICRIRNSYGSNMEMKKSISFYVAFGESEICKGQSVMQTMTEISNFTTRTLSLFDRFF